MAHTTVTAYIQTAAAEFEVEVVAEGYVAKGGSNAYGSDEPEWSEVYDLELTRPNGKPLPHLVEKKLRAENWDHICDALVEAEG